MKYFALLFFGIFFFLRLTTHYIDQVGMTKVLPTEIRTDYTEASFSKTELEQAMRYHGVLSIKENTKGEWYFIRDGRWCKVFGESCLVHINNGRNQTKSPLVTARQDPRSSAIRELTTTALGTPNGNKVS